MFNKTSSPDWMFAEVCECELPMCPQCDSDFYVDMARDNEFMPEDAEPPF